MSDKPCAECGGPMEEGYVADRGDYNVSSVAEWVEGAPETARFLGMAAGLNEKNRVRLRIRTLRCTRCGLLRFYAPDA
ncbi:MAG: hypothetical protein ICV87_03260 [Gemmatimonadetes bacterium]|nr:hypothetical protein [Gemmatimonadota bacterium]